MAEKHPSSGRYPPELKEPPAYNAPRTGVLGHGTPEGALNPTALLASSTLDRRRWDISTILKGARLR